MQCRFTFDALHERWLLHASQVHEGRTQSRMLDRNLGLNGDQRWLLVQLFTIQEEIAEPLLLRIRHPAA